MKERLRHKLHPDVQQALQEAQRLTGHTPVIKRVEHLPHDTHAVLKPPVTTRQPYEIQYLCAQERLLNHLIVHEVGHIVRLHQVPETERLHTVLTPDARTTMARQVIRDLTPLLDAGLPEETAVELISDWHEGVATQLTNFPADLRIEQWIHDRYPGLRRVQERSLVEEVHRSYPLLSPVIAALTPRVVYQATMAMNAAQAVHVSSLYRHPELLTPFTQHGWHERGQHLARLVFDVPDAGHRSDMTTTNAWARTLTLTGWFDWQTYTSAR